MATVADNLDAGAALLGQPVGLGGTGLGPAAMLPLSSARPVVRRTPLRPPENTAMRRLSLFSTTSDIYARPSTRRILLSTVDPPQ